MSMYVWYDGDRGVSVVHIAQIGFKMQECIIKTHTNNTKMYI